MKRLFVELLFAIDPAKVGLDDKIKVRGPAEEADLEVTLFSYDAAVLVTVGGVFNSTLQALSRSQAVALDVLGDLGSNEAAVGLLQPIKASLLDVCGYSRHLQNRESVPAQNDGQR